MLAHSYHPDHPPRRPESSTTTDINQLEQQQDSTTDRLLSSPSPPVGGLNPLYQQLHPDQQLQPRTVVIKDESPSLAPPVPIDQQTSPSNPQSSRSMLTKVKQWKEDHLEPQGRTLHISSPSSEDEEMLPRTAKDSSLPPLYVLPPSNSSSTIKAQPQDRSKMIDGDRDGQVERVEDYKESFSTRLGQQLSRGTGRRNSTGEEDNDEEEEDTISHSERDHFSSKLHDLSRSTRSKLVDLGFKDLERVSQKVQSDELLVDPRVTKTLDRPLTVDGGGGGGGGVSTRGYETEGNTSTDFEDADEGDETETEGERTGVGRRTSSKRVGQNGGGLGVDLGRTSTRDSDWSNGGYVTTPSVAEGASFYSAESHFGGTVESLAIDDDEEGGGQRRSESPVSFTVDGTSPPTRVSPSPLNNGIDRSPVAYAPGHVHTNSRMVPPLSPRSSSPSSSSSTTTNPRSTSPRLGGIPLPYVSSSSSSPPKTNGRLIPTASVVKPSTSHPSLRLANPPPPNQHLLPPSQSSLNPNSNPTRRASTTAMVSSSTPMLNGSSTTTSRRGSSASNYLRPSQQQQQQVMMTNGFNSSSSSSGGGMMPPRSFSTSQLIPSSPSSSLSQQLLPPNASSTSSYTSLSYPPPLPHSPYTSSHLSNTPSQQQHNSLRPLPPTRSPTLPTPSIHDDVESSIALQAEQIRRQRLEKRLEAEKVENALSRDGLNAKNSTVAGGGGNGKKGSGGDEEHSSGLGLLGTVVSLGDGGVGGPSRRRTSRNASGSRLSRGEDGGGPIVSSSTPLTGSTQAMMSSSSSGTISSALPPPIPSAGTSSVGVGLGKTPSVRSSSLPKSEHQRNPSGGSLSNHLGVPGGGVGGGGSTLSRRSVSGESQILGPSVPPPSTGSSIPTSSSHAQLVRSSSHQQRTVEQHPSIPTHPQQFSNEKEKEAEESAPVGPSPGTGVLVGNLIGTDHENYVLMYNMLTGIRIGVSRCQAKATRPLTDADYTARHKFSFDIVGNELTPSVKYDFKFKDYAPWVFRELREFFFLDPSDYLVSLTAKYILSELGSPGKSGSFFYFSRDYRFIIKTIRHAEHKFLRKILKEYHEHIKKNPHTLLSRFYGLHRVKLPHGRKIHFVIMNNLFPPHRDIHETYDLKGSSIGRLYPESRASSNPHAVLKDLNWILRHRQLALGPEKKALFEEQLRRDTELMQKLGIMDYSLLTGVHMAVKGNDERLREGKLSVFQPNAPKPTRKPTQVHRSADASALRAAVQRSDPQSITTGQDLPEHDTSIERRRFLFYQDEGGMRATGDGNEDLGVIYYLGIIDILTPYTMVKRLEHFFKGIKNDKHMISAVPPKEYGDRFLAFIRSCMRGNDETLRPRMCMPPIEEEELFKEGQAGRIRREEEEEKRSGEEGERLLHDGAERVEREKGEEKRGKEKVQ